MKQLMTVTCLLLAIAPLTHAQGRGGRQGGPGGPVGPLCLNPSDVKSMQITKSVRGADGEPTSQVLISLNPGGGGLNPCPAGLGGEDPLAKHFFSPDVIISHQQAINLTDAQRTSLSALTVDAQKSFVPAQFKIAAEMDRLESLIGASPVDEGKVLEEVDRVLALEREIKRAQLTLMVRAKNLLTQQQQDALAKLRSDH